MPTWPDAVPHMPTQWQVSQSNRANLESEMQSGKTRSRRRNTKVIGVASLTIKMTTAQFGVFKAFVANDLGSGSAEFDMPFWDGTGCPIRRCRIRGGGQYSYQKTGPSFFVSLELDVQDL